MKTWGSGGIAPPLFSSALDGGEWSASRHGRFTPGEITSSTHLLGCWVGLIVGLDAVEKRKILPCRESDPGPQSVARRYTDWAFPTPSLKLYQ
jgi:hypothetical protein